jgi:uncharacterized membrane protein
MKILSRQSLWQRLQSGGLVEGDIPLEETGETLWYVRLMLGVAGWIGSLFLLGFVGVGFAFVMRNAIAALVVGGLVSGGAYAIFKTRQNSDFFTQFGLAVGLAGQMMLIYGIFELFDHNEPLIYGLIFVAEALLTFLMPNFIYRVLSSLAAALALTFALHSAGVYGLASGLLAAGFLLVWLQDVHWVRFSELCRPVGYGLAFSLLYHKTGVFWGDWIWWSRSAGPNWLSQNAPWLGKALLLSVFLGVVFVLLKRLQIAVTSRSGLAALVATGIGIAAAFAVPGLGQGWLILLIGFAVCNRVLIGTGLLASGAFLSNYYYLLQSTLLEKSLLLIGIGAVLLISRVLVRIWLPLSEKGQADA